MQPETMNLMRPRSAYDSGRHYARAGLTPNWSALWISGRYDEFLRGYGAGHGQKLKTEGSGRATTGIGRGE
jgi:hypothetical protein